MARWTVKVSWSAGPAPVRDLDYAYSFVLRSNDGRQTKTTVEFATGRGGSALQAHEVLAPYLDQDMPPRRLVVDPAGNVSAEDA